jgi:trigger factor
MTYKINKLPKSQVEILFEVSFEEVEKFTKEAVAHIGEHIAVQGFRSGHIPEDIVKREVGEMAILEEAAEHSISENYKKAVLESKIEPISQPQVEIKKLAQGNPLEFKILVSVMPEVELPDFRKIAQGLKRNPVLVDEKEVKDSLAWICKSRASFSLKNEPAKTGDFVDIEFSSPALEGGRKYPDAFVLGEGHFVEGFENNLIEMKDGQEKTFSVKFPSDYQKKELAGKDVEFTVRIKAVQKMDIPEMTDDFAKKLGNFENVDALKKNVNDGLLTEKQKAETDRLRNAMLEKISEEMSADIPDSLINLEKQRVLEDLKERVRQGLQVSFEEYLKKINKTEKELLDSFSEQAQKRARFGLALAEIAKSEKIEATEDEIAKETQDFLKKYPDVKTVQSQFDPDRLREYIKEAIMNEKTFKFLDSLIQV